MSDTSINNPISKGDTVTIPAGTPLRSMNPRHEGIQVTRKTRTVTVHHTDAGYIQRWDEHNSPRGTVILPTITWPGGGGYWQTVQVTPDLVAVNGLDPLVMPDLDRVARYEIGLNPDDDASDLLSFDDGYTNRWAVPA